MAADSAMQCRWPQGLGGSNPPPSARFKRGGIHVTYMLGVLSGLILFGGFILVREGQREERLLGVGVLLLTAAAIFGCVYFL